MHTRPIRPRTAVAGLGACAVLSLFAPLLSPTAAAAQPPAELYEGHVQVDRGQPEDPETLTGQVFDDVNQNSKLDGDEKGVPESPCPTASTSSRPTARAATSCPCGTI